MHAPGLRHATFAAVSSAIALTLSPHAPSGAAAAARADEAAGANRADDIERASTEAGSLGLFVRSLVGMDRSAAKDVFAEFLDDQRYSANQIEYINMVIDHIAEAGTIEARRFYESPYTDVAPEGPDGLFEPTEVDRLIAVVHDLRSRADVGSAAG